MGENIFYEEGFLPNPQAPKKGRSALLGSQFEFFPLFGLSAREIVQSRLQFLPFLPLSLPRSQPFPHFFQDSASEIYSSFYSTLPFFPMSETNIYQFIFFLARKKYLLNRIVAPSRNFFCFSFSYWQIRNFLFLSPITSRRSASLAVAEAAWTRRKGIYYWTWHRISIGS